MSRLVCLVCFVFALLPSWGVQAQFSVIGEPNDAAATGVFDQNKVRGYALTISSSDLNKINSRPSAEEWVRGTLVYEGKTYANVGVRYKGSVGGFLYPCTNQQTVGPAPGRKVGRCSIKIGFDKFVKDQRFFGLKTINLHSMGRDYSRLKERLGYSMFREMNVAAPRTMHATVTINGQLEGLFLAVEQIDDEFTESRFAEGGKGNLYKEVWPMYNDEQTYRNALESNKSSSAAKMVAFKRAIDSGVNGVAQWMERDYIMRYLAVDRVIVNDDGAMHWYCGSKMGNNVGGVGNHNYYWYEALNSNREWLIPWDLDSSLTENDTDFVRVLKPWNEPTTSCGCALSAGFSSQRAAYCDKLIAVWAGQKNGYEAAVDEFIRGPFSATRVNAKITAWVNQLRPYIREAGELEHSVDEATWNEYLTDLRRILNEARANRGFWY
ncbi:MAG: CotH kinase family protein [Polyangiales bacterium]